MVRRNLLSTLIIALLGATISCDDAFDPHGEFIERPVLYCVMEGNLVGMTSQSALLGRTVPGKAFSVYSDSLSSPAIRGAALILRAQGTAYVLAETLMTIWPGTPQEALQLRYAIGSMWLKPTDNARIEATLPDGRVLTASTSVPPYLYFEQSYRFPHGFTTAVNPITRGSAWAFSWEAPEGLLHFPELTLRYSVQRDDTTTIERFVRIPRRTVASGGGETPVFPTAAFDRSCDFEYRTIDSVFAGLGRGEGEFLKLVIHSLNFSVTTYDAPLARYYTSSHGSMDPYSIRIDEMVYSNISGGLGVFGTYVVSRDSYAVDEDYIESFGYFAR